MILFQRDTWQEIYFSLRKNKLRTILTMIGVGWGMFLYVFLLGAAKGVENGFNKIFDGFATNSMFVWAEETGEPYAGFPRGRQMDLRLGDVEAIKNEVHDVDFVLPRNVSGMFNTNPGVVIRGSKNKAYTIYGDFPLLTKVEKKNLISGRFLSEDDIKYKRKVAVIGKEVYDQLFDKGEKAVGQYIKISGIYFQVIGVYKLVQQAGMTDEASIFIPFDTFQSMYNFGDKIGWMVVAVKPNKDLKKTENDVKAVLKKRHNASPTDEKAFGSFNFGVEFKKMTGFLTGMQILTWVVGGLTILAGVIAISNILLITVKERTKEIGIRRALGAKPGIIKSQILLESVTLTVISGIIGFIFGTLLLAAINAAVGNSEGFPFYNPTVNLWNVSAALALMVGLGLVIGLIPAQRAVQIKPIEALRTE